MAQADPEQPILIIGAGIVGLTLAQALQKSHIAFRIFERDRSAGSRGHGWGVTIHWALEALQHCLPPALHARLQSAQVDPGQGGRHDTGRFQVLDLSTATPKYVIPPSARLRLHRQKFREILLEGIDVQWGKDLDSFTTTPHGVEATFRDGSRAQGRLLVGADGSSSRTRQLLCPATGGLCSLPVRFLGATVRCTTAAITPLRAIDPLLFQGCHPDTGTFMWFSILSTPAANGSAGAGAAEEEYYEAQIALSWRVQADSDDEAALTTNAERLARLKELARPFERRLRTFIHDIPAGTAVREIRIQDWAVVDWDNCEGTVTLMGDAAHAMTMYRGQGINHAIHDAKLLLDALLSTSSPTTAAAAVTQYEQQMQGPAREAVLLSRRACLDAHDLSALGGQSPLVTGRGVRAGDES